MNRRMRAPSLWNGGTGLDGPSNPDSMTIMMAVLLCRKRYRECSLLDRISEFLEQVLLNASDRSNLVL